MIEILAQEWARAGTGAFDHGLSPYRAVILLLLSIPVSILFGGLVVCFRAKLLGRPVWREE